MSAAHMNVVVVKNNSKRLIAHVRIRLMIENMGSTPLLTNRESAGVTGFTCFQDENYRQLEHIKPGLTPPG